MNTKDILKYVDHTLLLQTATWAEIKQICDDGVKYAVASVCIPPAFVKRAKEYLGEKLAIKPRLNICTVIGFPNGYNTSEVKLFEAENAIKNGASEIDMVVNIGDIKDKNYDKITSEISAMRAVCGGNILKVIIETCLLDESEKIKMCEIVTETGADFIKTSTGFSSGGATKEDIILFSKHIGKDVKIKAAGGISTLQDAIDFINLGCARLGTSRIIKLAKNEDATGY